MKKGASWFMTASLMLVGFALLAAALAAGRLGTEENRYLTLYGLAGCFLFVLALAVVMPFFAHGPYRKILRVYLFVSSIILFLNYVFTGFMWMVQPGSLPVLLRVFPLLQGIYLVTAGVFNLHLSDERNLTYFLHLAREVPYLYYRYRI